MSKSAIHQKIMKKELENKACCVGPMPEAIVSVRDKEGNNNALVVGFIANVSLDPAMVMVGIIPSRYSHHMVKENPCFVINFPDAAFKEQYLYLGTKSGANENKFETKNIQWKDGDVVNAPILTDCPLNIECTVTESLKPGTHELFIAKVEKVHCLEEYLGATGKIDWSKIGIK